MRYRGILYLDLIGKRYDKNKTVKDKKKGKEEKKC
jgi:hypothetical protein